MTTKSEIFDKLKDFKPRKGESAPETPRKGERDVVTLPVSEPAYDHTWLPETVQDNVPIPAPKFGPIDRRMDVLSVLKVGQSFALPGHLVSLWRETASKMRKKRPETAKWEFTARSIDELNSRFWRVR